MTPQKKVFRLNTTGHPNAIFGQAEPVRDWLTNLMASYARQAPVYPDSPNMDGRSVTVIVEVIYD